MPVEIPAWVLALEAADGDPLRAQEIFERTSERWWTYHMAYRKAENDEMERQKRANARK